jgi:hypothetical protein
MKYFKKYINIFIIIILFISLCLSYILTIPVFEAPDENYHFLYSFYISKYNKLFSKYNESISVNQYIQEHIDIEKDPGLYADEKYAFLKKHINKNYSTLTPWSDPPTYYLVASQMIKPFDVDKIGSEFNYENFNNPNRFVNNKILADQSPTNGLVLVLRLLQMIFGIGIIIMIFQIIRTVTDDKFKNQSILLLSGIAFLPQFIFLCSYINNDIPSVFFGLISIYFMVLMFKKEKTSWGLLSILFAIIATLIKDTLFVMVPVTIITIFIWFIIKKKKIIIIGFLVFMILLIAAITFSLNFQKITQGRSELKESWADGDMGEEIKGFSFDGVDDMVIASSDYPSEAKELTIECNAFFNSFNKKEEHITTPLISNRENRQDVKSGILLRTLYVSKKNTLRWQFIIGEGDDIVVASGDILPYEDFAEKYAKKRLNISAVFEGEKYLKILINGEEIAIRNKDIPEHILINKASPLYFGHSGISYLNGIIDQVRIWDIANTEAHIKENMDQALTGDEEGLIGCWDFNEGKGSTVHDLTDNKNHGKIQVIEERSFPLLDRAKSVARELLTSPGNMFNFNKEKFLNSFKSSVAVFGWMNIFADNHIYYFFLAWITAGIFLFFTGTGDYRKSRRSIIFIIVSIISVYSFFLLHAFYTEWAQKQGRVMFTAVILTFILAILGYNTLKTRYRNIVYYLLFSCSLFISIFSLYKYIYLQYY